MSSFEKLRLLVWKNWKIQQRHKLQSVFEILSPLIFTLVLLLVRCLVDPQPKPPLSYTAFSPTFYNLTGRDLGNLSTIKREGTLAFSPENPILREVVTSAMVNVAEDNLGALALFFDPSTLPPPRGYANAKEMEIALTKPNAMKTTLVGVEFEQHLANMTKWPDKIKVALRFPAVMRNPMLEHPLRASWRTNLLYPIFPKPSPRYPGEKYGGKAPGYSTELFLAVQHGLSRQIIKSKTGEDIKPKVHLKRMPQEAYTEDPLLIALEKFISMIIMLAFAYTFVNTVRVITAEKELQLKETMIIMGLKSWLHWAAWFIKQFTFLLISVLLMVILLKTPFNKTSTGEGYSILTFVPWSVLIFFLTLYIMASITFSFMISVFFSRANTAAAFMGLAWLTTYSVFMLTQVMYEEISLTTKMLLSLISNTAMGYMFQMIVIAEGTKGLQWGDFFKPISYHDPFRPGDLALILVLDTILYLLIAMYVEKIMPGRYGVPQPWYFPFKKSYWFPKSKEKHSIKKPNMNKPVIKKPLRRSEVTVGNLEERRPSKVGNKPEMQILNFEIGRNYFSRRSMDVGATSNDFRRKKDSDAEYNDALLRVVHDEVPKDAKLGVNIKNLVKVYKGRKKAVDNLNLRIYQNEITVLLGHNGAGKTTTISMMTGMVRPTSGTAIINGYNIVTQTERARKSIGICPQHNVLFPYLTVGEHIRFYGRLKGVPKNKINEEVDHFVKLLELEDKKNTISKNLSGGQKRRLSVGSAMCGNSRVVLLDEPTSGLDPAARRALWDLLQKEKKGRTIILTTHFMDEADVLGDRIAIMSGGRLQCVGTSYFLKKHYGTGYNLTIVKAAQCDAEQVTQFFKKFIPDIQTNTNIGSELSYILKTEHVDKFPEMLKQFEEKKQSLHVSSYGLSITSLEEVFMKAGAEAEIESSSNEEQQLSENPTTSTRLKQQTVSTVNMASVTVMPKNGNGINTNSKSTRDAATSMTLLPPGHPSDPPENTVDFSEIEKVKGNKLLRYHIKAMFLKRYYSTLRSKMVALVQCVSPVINICISVIVSRSWKFLTRLPPLTLNLESGFRATDTLISKTKNLTDSAFESKVMNTYKDYFKESTYPHMSFRDIGDMDLGKYYLKLFNENPGRVRYEVLVGATFSPDHILGWFSNYGYHDPAISLSLINDAILRAFSPNSTLQFVNHPLPYSVEHLVKVMATGSSMGFQFAFNIGFCMAFVTAFLVLFVVKERKSGAKLLQRVSGVQPVVLWSCSFVWDWFWLAFVYLFIIVPLAIIQESTLSTPAELGRIYLVLMVFSLAAIPFHYLTSLMFDSPAMGFARMCFINMFLGCMPFLIIEVLKIPAVGSTFYANIFDWIFSPLPLYCLSRSFRDMAVSSFTIMACDAMCDQFNIKDCSRKIICKDLKIDLCCIEDDPFLSWSDPGIGRYLFMMSLLGFVFTCILMMVEYEVFKKLPKLRQARRNSTPLPATGPEDDDVAAERRRVEVMRPADIEQHSLVCKDLTKYFKNYLAVRRLSFGVNRGECFGLLGVNGAGKTSTFRMLTGDTKISWGDAFILGDSVKYDIRAVYRKIGYCPQFDALLDNLTAQETLHIFSLIRGIPADVGAARSKQLAALLGFTRHYRKMVYECSGGTKRKISTAVAMLGDSLLIYLDEPTTGMDPASKRQVWTSINKAVMAGRSVVLTSHSMEECEALCSRLTVMVNGQLYCLGPLQHLKSKFSQGYTLIVKCKVGPDREADLVKVNEFIAEKFPGSKLVESYLGISTYYLSDSSIPWYRVFEVMEAARAELPIEDYSVSQTTLEQVFLKFSRAQAQPARLSKTEQTSPV